MAAVEGLLAFLALGACLCVANAGEVTTSRPFLIDSQVVDMQVSKGGGKVEKNDEVDCRDTAARMLGAT